MHSTSNRIRILSVGSLAPALCLPLPAQTTTGQILGSVTDPPGAGIAGAAVLVTDTQHGTTRAATTGPSGGFAVPELEPGTYKISAEHKGVRTVEPLKFVIEVA